MPRTASNVDGFLDWVRLQAKGVRKAVKRIAGKAKPRHVKRARVAARRLSVAMDLIEPLMERRRLRSLTKRLAAIGNQLGPVRDADVLREAASRVRASATVRASMIEQLDRRRVRAAKKARKSLHPNAYKIDKRLMKDISAAGPALTAQLREAVHAQLDTLAGAILSAAGAPRGLHPARIAAKRLRYLLEIGVTLGVRSSKDATMRLERLQDDLGDWHDATVLATFSIGPTTNKHEFEHETAGAAARLAIASHAAANALAASKRFNRRWKSDGPILEQTLRRAMPAHTAAAHS